MLNACLYIYAKCNKMSKDMVIKSKDMVIKIFLKESKTLQDI